MIETPSPPRPGLPATTIFLVAFFFIGLWLPLLGNALGLAPESDARTEKRRLAHMPRLVPELAEGGEPAELSDWRASIDRFPRAFEAYYDDHFGFRPTLLRAHNVLKARLLSVSPTDQAVIGKEGWLFYAGQGGIEQFRAVDPLSDEDLDEWQQRLELADEWLSDRGVQFLFFVAPAKPSVYGDFLPSTIRRLGEESRLDQFVRHLRRHSNVRVIDPRPAFARARDEIEVYRRTDTHWNQAGGLVGYQALAEVLRERWPAIEVPTFADFEITTERIPGGDIATVMGLADVFEEDSLHLEPRAGWPYRRVEAGLMPPLNQERREVADERRPHGSERDDPALPRLVLFRDSFGTELIPYLGIGTSRGVYYWQFVIDPRVVAFEEPDIVVQEIGERVLMFDKLNHIQDELTIDFERRRRFRALGQTFFALASGREANRLTFEGLEVGFSTGDGQPILAGASPGGTFRCRVDLTGRPTGPVVLRLELRTPDLTHLRITGAVDDFPERRLRLRHDIVYADVTPGSDGEVVLEFEGRPGTYEILALDLRSDAKVGSFDVHGR